MYWMEKQANKTKTFAWKLKTNVKKIYNFGDQNTLSSTTNFLEVKWYVTKELQVDTNNDNNFEKKW